MSAKLKITSHSDGQKVLTPMIQILGTGEPGLEITVDAYGVANYPTRNSKRFWPGQEKCYKTFKTTIDKNGKWYIPGFPVFGHVNWMRRAFIPYEWKITAASVNPNYREGNLVRIKLDCKY